MPQPRSVKIDQDERGGWSSDRPRRDGQAERPRTVDVSVRGRVLDPTFRLRYHPGSTVVIVSGSAELLEKFTERTVEDKAAIISLDRVKRVLKGRVADEELDAKAVQLLDAAIAKRLGAKQGVILLADGADPAERERVVRLAHANRSARHLILLEAGRDETPDDVREPLNELRKALEANKLGDEGFHTSLRLGGGTIAELKRIVFRPPPEDE